MDKTGNQKMDGNMKMMNMMMQGMKKNMTNEQIELTIGYGDQGLYVEHSQGYLTYKEGDKKEMKNYYLCCVSGNSHRPEFEVGSEVVFTE